MYNKIIIRDNIPYDILRKHIKSKFENKDGSLNKQVLGLYVKEVGGDRVLEMKGYLLICKTVEDANYEDIL